MCFYGNLCSCYITTRHKNKGLYTEQKYNLAPYNMLTGSDQGSDQGEPEPNLFEPEPKVQFKV
jgi:hypothetical protein